MTKKEAIQAMREGKRVTHRHFTIDEWISMEIENKPIFDMLSPQYDRTVAREIIVTEDGYRFDPDEFWSHRTIPTFDNGWSIFKE